MSPKITITKGERQVEIEISDRAVLSVSRIIRNEVVNNLGPDTRRPYEQPYEREVANQLLKLAQRLFEAGKQTP